MALYNRPEVNPGSVSLHNNIFGKLSSYSSEGGKNEESKTGRSMQTGRESVRNWTIPLPTFRMPGQNGQNVSNGALKNNGMI